MSIVMFRQMYYTWENRIHSGKRERERGHFLPEEVEGQVENTSRNVGIKIVWKKERENYCQEANVWMEDCFILLCIMP